MSTQQSIMSTQPDNVCYNCEKNFNAGCWHDEDFQFLATVLMAKSVHAERMDKEFEVTTVYQWEEENGDDVCCVGCGERVCGFTEEPPHKDRKDEAVCDDCWVTEN